MNLWQKFVNLLYGVAIGLIYWLILNLVALVWSLFFGWIGYGFSMEAVMVALYIAAISAVASLPAFLAMDSNLAEPYYCVGGIVGAILTGAGGVIYFILRFFLHVNLPDAWTTALWVGGISVGLAAFFFFLNLRDERAKYRRFYTTIQ